MTTVSLDMVRKIYANGVEAVKPCNFKIPDGEFVVLVGPSGCGKSTLLRMIAGLEEISGGTITIGQRVVNDVDPAGRNIAMVFQNYALYPHMTVAKNMAYGLKNRGLPKAEIEQKVKDAAKMLNLSDYLGRRPSQLSGGQRQRVAMGRAIVRNPELFLFDEPLSNLDAKLRNQMRIEIRSLQRRLGVTAVYVTHDQIEAMTMADRIIVLNEGRVEQIGTPSEIYNQPASTFVAGFMGAPPMNLLKAHRTDEGKINLGNGSDLDLAAPKKEASEFLFGVRPEDIIVAPEGAEGTMTFDVDIVEELGANHLLHGKLADQDFSVSVPKTVDAKTGPVSVAIGPDVTHFFAVDTGVRL
ncbi:carbohydrate ABC transporter ATP-binding protein, CUT1 family [Cohaesibacter sp. ES.047]|uniref:sn-glycerol-3-phosphate ABC transporter ATP-binding protein UgpC n=1 Tax=Cohaesibacter sp. ES.047 TaxID=1798205 RepID=UPI000BB9B4B2|nr:sn-glycerol-3-phosphate ABC transporter ATP-binding protein UgpC [Cohaesibacter sp. ES.047]SNY90029.1 carbohydrate ABC transporter ATP-binding protein, CUT1 family [Cohaesibacter sp. ES.047]